MRPDYAARLAARNRFWELAVAVADEADEQIIEGRAALERAIDELPLEQR